MVSIQRKTKLLFCIAVCFSQTAFAEEEFLTRSRAIIEHVDKLERPSWLDPNNLSAIAKAQARSTIQSAQKNSVLDSVVPRNEKKTGRQFVIYASTSLGDDGLKALFAEAAGRTDVVVVFRGVKKGQKIPTFTHDLYVLAKKNFPPDKMPHMVIDPTRFRKAGVDVVPTLTLEDNGDVLAKVEGVYGTQWLLSHIGQDDKARTTQQLGVKGPTKEIAELDLIDEMQNRVKSIDWEEKKNTAIAHYWNKYKFYTLPDAPVDRVRVIDPTVTSPRDLVTPNGKLVVRAGQRVNPLDFIPFTQRLLVFNGTKPEQVMLVKQLGEVVKNRHVMYVTTEIEKSDGWIHLTEVETAIGAPVYLLTPEVRDKFELEHVPVMIEQSGNKFQVNEFNVAGFTDAKQWGGEHP